MRVSFSKFETPKTSKKGWGREAGGEEERGGAWRAPGRLLLFALSMVRKNKIPGPGSSVTGDLRQRCSSPLSASSQEEPLGKAFDMVRNEGRETYYSAGMIKDNLVNEGWLPTLPQEKDDFNVICFPFTC